MPPQNAAGKNAIHNIILEGRKKMSVSGVTDVDRFDENTVLLYTTMGEMTVRGEDLHVNDLSVESGEMNIEGEIRSVIYGDIDRRSPLSFVGKIFR
ncbi:MAG: sporulation protein YabP [Oscillospiraceae bacterium]|nr:sporulation protein YabP [Oscillospiraceae bacterium]